MGYFSGHNKTIFVRHFETPVPNQKWTTDASELKISPADIWFVGNSVNDRFAYKSGAKTLCINPKLTDPTNQTVWNRCIPKCENLLEIFQYI